jgi:hypothetical protein
MKFPCDAINRLAALVLQGDVVFFIGAGFSVDSEGNTAQRLVRRLLIRLLGLGRALDEVLGQRTGPGSQIRKNIQHTFDLKANGRGAFPFTKSDVRRLADRYYETNDWFCNAFGNLLLAAQDLDGVRLRQLLAATHRHEEEIRTTGKVEDDESGADQRKPKPPEHLEPQWDKVPLKPFAPELFGQAADDTVLARATAGKALFLDTMGFRDPEIMGGEPRSWKLADVERSYGTKLLPRHHVLARLAREGFCTTTLTANYDMLLEGAFRLAGFSEKATGRGQPVFPHTLYSDFAVIASPAEFFSEGKAHSTAVLVKMHGCAQHYRNIPSAKAERLREYLRSMVFTYREIQNWREDSWAADYLRTLLRTRTVVFSGYSLQDPVVHDTFRTVYEEMARERLSSETRSRRFGPEMAPAFFLAPGKEEKREFHGMEVLRAASAAVGAARGPFGQHPNYLRFCFRGDGFPNLDDIFRWLFHRVARLRQRNCLETDLGRVLTALLGRPRPAKELDGIRKLFQQLLDREVELAAQWRSNPPSRREHALFSAWTESFHPGLLREFAAADLVRRGAGSGVDLARLQRVAWYYPFTQDAGWTCWGAVVEVALRRVTAILFGREPAVLNPLDLHAATAIRPTALFRPLNDPGATPCAVTILFAGAERDQQVRPLNGHAVTRQVWRLSAEHAPWRRADGTLPPVHGMRRNRLLRRPFGMRMWSVPPANVLWAWASAPSRDIDQQAARLWLGIPSL